MKIWAFLHSGNFLAELHGSCTVLFSSLTKSDLWPPLLCLLPPPLAFLPFPVFLGVAALLSVVVLAVLRALC